MFDPELGIVGPALVEERTVYRFESGQYPWTAEPLVFPLPRVEGEEAPLASPADNAE
jgi:hypothetical protein